MRYIPHPPLTLLLALSLLLVGCGSGSTGVPNAPLPSSKATLTGEVLSIDGDAAALDGVVLALRETGQLAESAADGWFSFGEVPAGSLTIDLVSAASFSAKAGDTPGGSAAEDDGDDDDDNDLDDDCMNMERVRAQERIHLRIRIQDGELGEMQCVREENTERETERHMERTPTNADPDMQGEMEMEQHRERERFRIQVEHADVGSDLEAVVIAPDGSEESLGPCTVQANGECAWNADTSNGGRLPFGAAGVEALEGYRVQVRAHGTGNPLLTGQAPGLPPVGDHTRARTEEQNQERAEDSDGAHDRDQDRDRDGNYGDDA